MWLWAAKHQCAGLTRHQACVHDASLDRPLHCNITSRKKGDSAGHAPAPDLADGC